jgi:FtsH-binding integral membrane protein
MTTGVCSLWGWGLIWWTPAFLMRTYNLNVGEAGAVTGPIHLIGGIAASLGTAWLLSRPRMQNPHSVLWVLIIGVGLTTIPSFLAYWTHTLWIAKCMFWIFIPAIYFYIGPCMGLLQNLAPHNMRSMFIAWSLLVGNVFNLIVAPQAIGMLSDWYAGPSGSRWRFTTLRVAGTRPRRFLGHLACLSRDQDGDGGYAARRGIQQPLMTGCDE